MSHATLDEAPHQRMVLSVDEVAVELGCGRDTVYSLLASGRLPSVRISDRLRRVRRADLVRYIDDLAESRPAR